MFVSVWFFVICSQSYGAPMKTTASLPSTESDYISFGADPQLENLLDIEDSDERYTLRSLKSPPNHPQRLHSSNPPTPRYFSIPRSIKLQNPQISRDFSYTSSLSHVSNYEDVISNPQPRVEEEQSVGGQKTSFISRTLAYWAKRMRDCTSGGLENCDDQIEKYI
jgi:hypothetical protein